MLEYIVKPMYEPRDPSALGIARFFYGKDFFSVYILILFSKTLKCICNRSIQF